MRQAYTRGFAAVLVLAAALAGGGCATMWRGHSETIVIESDPVGASVRLGNGFTGRTPATFVVPRKGDLAITVSHEGYETMSVILRPTIGGGTVLAGTAGNTVTAVGAGVVIASSVTVSGGGAVTATTAAGVATGIAVATGAAVVGGVAIDVGSGAMLSHASGPIRFVMRPFPPIAP